MSLNSQFVLKLVTVITIILITHGSGAVTSGFMLKGFSSKIKKKVVKNSYIAASAVYPDVL